MKVLVTGISGFVGPHLAEFLLEKKFRVTGTVKDRSENTLNFGNRIEIFSGDLLSGEFVYNLVKKSKPDLTFHLAAFTSPAESFEDPTKVVINNVQITINLLEALRKVGKTDSRTLIVGSADEYGLVQERDNPVKEDAPLRPVNPYAVSKVAQDFLGLQYHLAYKLNTIRVRPGNQIGPGQRTDFVISSFAKQVAGAEKGKQRPVIKVGNLEVVRDFTDVRDMIKAYLLAVLQGKPGEVYNLGSGFGLAIREVLNRLVSLSKVKLKIKKDPARIRPLDVPKLIIDASKFKELTGWQPKIKIEQTLKDVLNYWRENA